MIQGELDQMASIEEELALVKQAKAAIENPSKDTVEDLRKAIHMARTQATVFSSALNEARHNVVVALIEGQPNQEKISKAKSAIDAWIKELERGSVIRPTK